jgi:hypothetical protein
MGFLGSDEGGKSIQVPDLVLDQVFVSEEETHKIHFEDALYLWAGEVGNGLFEVHVGQDVNSFFKLSSFLDLVQDSEKLKLVVLHV